MSVTFTLNQREIKSMLKKMTDLQQGFKFEAGRALYMEGQIEMTEAKKRTPVDTGTLQASGTVSLPETGKGDAVKVRLYFGGAAKAYALYVHEDLEAFHKQGQAKFLESVLNESAPYMKARIAKRINLNRAMKNPKGSSE
jgi:Bacteriophage HK97-gp10, putative tail-component